MDNRTQSALVVSGISCLVLVAALLANLPLVAASAKVVATCGFLGVAILAGAWQSTYGRVLLFGLALSFLGDVFLIGSTQSAFLGGLTAFLLAHLAYVTAFVVIGINLRWLAIAALPIIGIAIGVASWLSPHTPPELTLPVTLYIVVISSMVIAAFGTRGTGASTLILAGALMFFLSDLAVALARLVDTDFPHYVWGLPLYYAAQLCLALSVSQSRSH